MVNCVRHEKKVCFFIYHRLGDLLCCETCSAVYHLTCVEPPLEEVPDDDWLCVVCRAHQVTGFSMTPLCFLILRVLTPKFF